MLPKAEPVIYLNFSWFQKPATRLPEALWLSFRPIASDPNGWLLEKSGEAVSPLDVVQSGNRHMHAVSRAFGYKDGSGALFGRDSGCAGYHAGCKVALAFFEPPA